MKEVITSAISKIEEMSLQNDRLKQNETVLVEALKNAQSASEAGLAEAIEGLKNTLLVASSAKALTQEEIQAIIDGEEIPAPEPEVPQEVIQSLELYPYNSFYIQENGYNVEVTTDGNSNVIIRNSDPATVDVTVGANTYAIYSSGQQTIGTMSELHGKIIEFARPGFTTIKKRLKDPNVMDEIVALSDGLAHELEIIDGVIIQQSVPGDYSKFTITTAKPLNVNVYNGAFETLQAGETREFNIPSFDSKLIYVTANMVDIYKVKLTA